MKIYIARSRRDELEDDYFEKVFLDHKKARVFALLNGADVEEHETFDDEFTIPTKLYTKIHAVYRIEKDEFGDVYAYASTLFEGYVEDGNNGKTELKIYMPCSATNPRLTVNTYFDSELPMEEARKSASQIGHIVLKRVIELHKSGKYDVFTDDGLKRLQAEQLDDMKEQNK